MRRKKILHKDIHIDIQHLCCLQFKSIKVELQEELSLHVWVYALKHSKTPNLYL